MRKIHRIKGEEKLVNRTSVLTFDDPGAAAAYAAQEAFAAGVSPSAVMYSAPDGAGNGDDAEAPGGQSDVGEADVESLQHSGPPVKSKLKEKVVDPEESIKKSIKTPESSEEVVSTEIQVDTPVEPEAETKDDAED